MKWCYHASWLQAVHKARLLVMCMNMSVVSTVTVAAVDALQGGGVFANPTSKQAPAKLRLLYEAAPLGLVVEAAGGLAECSTGSVLDMVISQTDVRTSISLGSTSEVVRSRPAMQWQQE